MAETPWVVRDVPEQTRRKVKVYAASHGITMAKAIEEIVNRATTVSPITGTPGAAAADDDIDMRQRFVQLCLERGWKEQAREIQETIARFYFEHKVTSEAVAALQQLIAMDRTNIEAYDMLGQTYESVGEVLQAERVYRNLQRAFPDSPIAQKRLIELAMQH